MIKNLFFLFLILSLLIIDYSLLISIEVYGHLTEDTTWSPENNPYQVIDNIFVDENVTLTIQPGTEIRISGAPLTSWQDYDEYFWFENGTNEAKMFWIDGRIIAEGTEQDSIIFSRLQDDFDYYWGSIYMTEQSDLSIFRYCRLEYSGSTGIALGLIARSVLSFFNGRGIISNNEIVNNGAGIIVSNFVSKIEIIDNSFFSDDLNNFVLNFWPEIVSVPDPELGAKSALIAGNVFGDNIYGVSTSSSHFVCNTVKNVFSNGIFLHGDNGRFHFYNNNFENCEIGIGGGNHGQSLYIKNNRFVGGNEGVDIDDAYVEISDNYFEECRASIFHSYSSKFANNILTGSSINGNIGIISNNLILNNEIGLSGRGEDQFSNNIFINNNYIFSSLTENHIIENQIFLNNEDLYDNFLYGNPIFRNCILDFELPEECIDGGGNIWVDSLLVQTLFEDIENGNFHLIEGSLAIDSGFDTTGYYYPFDMDYNHRVWDGDNDGTSIIDIGPYEYNSPQFGRITGTIYQSENGEFLNYVLLKINNQPGEFTFSDSIGNYEFRLPAGIYDLYAERVFYDDAVVYDIVVHDGEYTEIDFYMNSTVDVDDFTISDSDDQIFHLSNYPNPFNPTTKIAFNLSTESNVSVSIYNIKGQKVKQLADNRFEKGRHSIQWNGTDSNDKSVSSGIYFYKISTTEETQMKKMLMLK